MRTALAEWEWPQDRLARAMRALLARRASMELEETDAIAEVTERDLYPVNRSVKAAAQLFESFQIEPDDLEDYVKSVEAFGRVAILIEKAHDDDQVGTHNLCGFDDAGRRHDDGDRSVSYLRCPICFSRGLRP